MPFLDNKKNIIDTTDLLPPSPKKFDGMLDNNFCIPLLKNALTNEEYIQQKADFLKSGDAKILVYSWNVKHKQADMFGDYHVMTEETRNQNDGKLFKKLPSLCDFLNVPVITAVDYLRGNGFKIKAKV